MWIDQMSIVRKPIDPLIITIRITIITRVNPSPLFPIRISLILFFCSVHYTKIDQITITRRVHITRFKHTPKWIAPTTKMRPIILPSFSSSEMNAIQNRILTQPRLHPFAWCLFFLVEFFSQSHLPLELEQGTLGLNAIRPTSEILPDDRTALAANVAVSAVHSTDSQMIPSHLKCGMWASLALATVFLAGLCVCVIVQLYA